MADQIKTYREFDEYYRDANSVLRTKHPDFHVFRLGDVGDDVKEHLGPFKTSYYQFAIGNAAKADLTIYNTLKISENYSLIIYLPGQIIEWKKRGRWDGYVVNAKESFFDMPSIQSENSSYRFLHSLDPIVQQITREDYFFLSHLFELILKEYEEFAGDSLLACRHLLHVLVICINRLLSAGRETSDVLDIRYRELAARFKSSVIRNYVHEKSVRFYANELGVSPAYLGEAVRKVYHTTPKKLIDEIIFMHAQTVLQTTGSGVKEVAYSLNFDDYSHFVKFFKKLSGITPAEFRKNRENRS